MNNNNNGFHGNLEDQNYMNNNNNGSYGNPEERYHRRPRTAEDLFTASEFLNQHCPRQHETRRQSEPRIHREHLCYERRNVSTGNIESEKASQNTHGHIRFGYSSASHS